MTNINSLNDFLNQKNHINFNDKINNSLYYAGIGSRETPLEIQRVMSDLAFQLERKGYVLRSGGALGADSAFEKGVKNNKKEIFYANDTNKNLISCDIAKHFHPKPFFLTYNKEDLLSQDFNKKKLAQKRKFTLELMARNTFQIMGLSLNEPVKFVLCYTKDGCEHHNQRTQETGGTGQAISIASYFNIPVFNLANQESLLNFKKIYLS